ncbi:M28 family metallopeptidase [Pigmentibacter ruber]|uniref:M28 family metallopeptidase n=1 Tax=Pigmentibacter ruber TaxID=2683196 RepID=UPI00131C62DC|nr:M28 family metallopeptidase [Pigmentibacter ruber]
MKRPSYPWFKILIWLFACFQAMSAHSISFQNSEHLSIENLKKFMDWFTYSPHPMGSKEQVKIANDLHATLKKMNLKVSEMKFDVDVPNLDSSKFGGKVAMATLTKKVTGINIIATKKGTDNCSIILGGHYDTKYFSQFKFVGANDGGSSTVLLLELARILQKTKAKKESYLQKCDIHFIFFDGEEAFLNDWNDGLNYLGIQDNTYGSKEFVKKQVKNKNGIKFYANKKINLVIILDMVGHKNQKLFFTKGSDTKYADTFIQHAKDLDISNFPYQIEDDHISFAQEGIPFLHIIDWKNLDEWHTSNDTIDIISFEKIKNLGNSIKYFLMSERK